jgi:hypothetical protein
MKSLFHAFYAILAFVESITCLFPIPPQSSERALTAKK